jgi:hypothetical protein
MPDMSDDDEPGSGNGMLWYAVGRSSGYRAGETDGYRDGEANGYCDGELTALRSVEAQQDAEWRGGWRRIHINDFNAWVALVNQRGQHIALLQDDNRSLEQQLAISKRQSNEESEKLAKSQTYHIGVEDVLRALLEAAERGKMHYPEYQQLKSVLQQMYDAWATNDAVLSTPDTLGPYMVALMKALER